MDGAPAQQEGIQVKGLIEGGLLYIGIPAATLYPLGFIALAVQLWRDAAFPYRDFTTVWEAVALIPQTVVVATGIRLIYLSVIATILGAAVAGMLLALSRRRKSGEGGEGRPPWGTPQNGRLWTIMLILLLPLAAAGLLVRGDSPLDGRPDNDLLYMAGFVPSCPRGFWLSSHREGCTRGTFPRRANRRKPRRYQRPPKVRRMSRGSGR